VFPLLASSLDSFPSFDEQQQQQQQIEYDPAFIGIRDVLAAAEAAGPYSAKLATLEGGADSLKKKKEIRKWSVSLAAPFPSLASKKVAHPTIYPSGVVGMCRAIKLVASLLFAIPAFVIGMVLMNIPTTKNALMNTDVWPRMPVGPFVLFLLATPVQFFIGFGYITKSFSSVSALLPLVHFC